MKKVEQITLKGKVFLINDDAFLILEKYWKDIKDHFYENEEDIKKIEKDFYNEIVENGWGGDKVLTKENILSIIEKIGKKNDFLEKNTEPVIRKRDNEKIIVKKWYRDSDNAVVAGVCSGTAKYFGIDVMIIRILFVLLFFFGGSSILIYIILWIIIPKAVTENDKISMNS